MKKTWDFLRGSIPEFQHSDESLPEMKPQAAAPAADGEPGLDESTRPGPEKTKGLSYATARQAVLCVHRHAFTHSYKSQLHTAHLIKLLN